MLKKGFTLILGILILVMGWFILPATLFFLNIVFGLPYISNSLLTFTGLILFTAGFSTTLYTVHQHLLTGRVTPVAIEIPKKFIVKGLYKYSRNPMYIAIFVAFLGMYLMFGTLLLLLYALFALILFHLIVVYYEEPQLKEKFGKPYIEYTKKVPRWLPKM